MVLMGIKPSRSKQLMVESDGLFLLKDYLEGIIKHFCGSPNIFLQPTNKYDIRYEEDQ